MSFEYDVPGTSSDAFAGALRDAINAKGVTLSWLQQRLKRRGNRVSMATLSYWRSGARRPEGAQSMAALADIEELLDLDEGKLARLLPSTKRTGPLGPSQFPLNEETIENAVKEAYAALGTPYPDASREVTTHSVTDVDANGNLAFSSTRSLLQATSGVVTATPFLEVTPGLRTSPPIFTAVSGGRISGKYSHASGEVHGVLFELDAPLTAPETTMVEWSVEYPADYPPTRETGHGVSRQCRELLVWTRFHPDALPDWCEERVQTPAGVTVTPVSLNGTGSVHQLHRSFGPGAVELCWGYGPRGDAVGQPG
jgi:hypothetical protein